MSLRDTNSNKGQREKKKKHKDTFVCTVTVSKLFPEFYDSEQTDHRH